MWCGMSLKIHFLYTHLEFFLENLLKAVSDKQSERFPQDIQTMEEDYQGVWNENIIGNFFGYYTVIIKSLYVTDFV